MSHYQKLKKHFGRLSHLHYVQRILMWDEAVMMPEGSGSYRAESVATLNQVMQKSIQSKEVRFLIEAAKQENLVSLWDKANLALMEKKYNLANCISSKLTTESTKALLTAFQAWRKYREQNNWKDFMPHLKKSFQFFYEIAERKSQILQLSPYETLMDSFSPGLTQSKVDQIFLTLKEQIPSLRKRIMERQSNDSILELVGSFPVEKQQELGLFLMRAVGFDFNHGRLDVSHHPFCDGVPLDIRITTRYDENDFLDSLFGVIHESGHALYEQGMPKEWVSQPVGQTQSKALHESQSLLFEYEVSHSRPFFEFLEEKIKQLFGENQSLTSENLYKLTSRVETNLIRVASDEVNYPLHVILRYEIEKQLFEKNIEIEDLPHIWNEQMLKYFNISTEGNFKDGVMQDMHWSWGYFGYFPSYTFGQLMAAQLYAAFLKENNDFENQLRVGDFAALHKWLQKNVYSYGSSISSEELLLKVTGESLNPNYFIKRVESRYLS